MRLYFLPVFLVLAACGDRSYTPTVPEALEVGTPVSMFAATNRALDETGSYGGGRSEGLALLDLTVSVPPERSPGELDFAYANPKPEKQFTMAARARFETREDFVEQLRENLANKPRGNREVVIFTHGYNATQAETAFRAAQIKYDLGLRAETVLFSWPSRGKPLSYAYDQDSIIWSRDALEDVLELVEKANPDNIIMVAHSMGSWLTIETLRQMDIERPGWPAEHIGTVVLMSPDIDVNIFRSILNRLSAIPEPFIIFSSRDDKALRVSSRLRGQQPEDRLGALGTPDRISDLPVTILDATAFSDDAESNHLVALTSPAALKLIKDVRALNDAFGFDPVTASTLLGTDLVTAGEAQEIVLEPEAAD